jgi:hypothetical protein
MIRRSPIASNSYRENCREALDAALRTTPAYEAWNQLDPGRHADIFSRYASMPMLTKQELRFYGYEQFIPGARDPSPYLARHDIELVATSGSTGDRVTNIWVQDWWNASEIASWKLNKYASRLPYGVGPEAILTSPFCAGFSCENGYLSREERTLGKYLFLT